MYGEAFCCCFIASGSKNEKKKKKDKRNKTQFVSQAFTFMLIHFSFLSFDFPFSFLKLSQDKITTILNVFQEFVLNAVFVVLVRTKRLLCVPYFETVGSNINWLFLFFLLLLTKNTISLSAQSQRMISKQKPCEQRFLFWHPSLFLIHYHNAKTSKWQKQN